MQCSATTSAAPGTSRRTAVINWITVSCVTTASSRIVESNARQVFPDNAPVSATTSHASTAPGFAAAANAPITSALVAISARSPSEATDASWVAGSAALQASATIKVR
jgi:hypothetical protein